MGGLGSAGLEPAVLGWFDFRATLVPLDTNMNTSLWDCRNCHSRKDHVAFNSYIIKH